MERIRYNTGMYVDTKSAARRTRVDKKIRTWTRADKKSTVTQTGRCRHEVLCNMERIEE